MPIRQQLPDFTNLVENGWASLDIPTGMSFHNLIFDFTGSGDLTRDMITEVEVLLNGKAFIKAPATVLHRDNLYKGSVDNPKFFVIDFEEPRSRTFADQIASAVHTYSGVQTFKVKFKIVGADSPKITTHANMTATQLPLGLLPCFVMQSFDAVSAGKHQIPYSYGKVAHLIKRAHIIPVVAEEEQLPGDHLETISLVKNNVPLYQLVSPESAAFYQQHYESIPQTNMATVDFVEDNNTTINLMTAQDWPILWELKVKVPARFDIYYSVLANIDAI